MCLRVGGAEALGSCAPLAPGVLRGQRAARPAGLHRARQRRRVVLHQPLAQEAWAGAVHVSVLELPAGDHVLRVLHANGLDAYVLGAARVKPA